MLISVDPEASLKFVLPCINEEPHTTVFLHIKDISMKGNETIAIRTDETDVLALSISAFTHLAYNVDQLRINFGTGKNSKFFAIHKIYEKIGADKVQAISFFNVFIGCDQLSFLVHVTKKSAWKI